MDARRRIASVDAAQRKRRWTAVAVATAKKFSEDKSTNLASMVAFWAIFSIFPLFLVLVTLLGWLLPADTKGNVLSNVANLLPLLDPGTVQTLSGSWWALIIGMVSALWSGSAVIRTVQFSFNSVWEVPMAERPGLGEKLARSLWVLATVGLGLVAATVISGIVTGRNTGIDLGPASRAAGYAIAIALDIGLFVAAFRLLTDRSITTRDVLPGAVLSGLSFWILQQVSTLIVSRYLQNAQTTYGNFATLITVLWWFYLQAIVTMLGAQLNVVLKKRLYPRSLTGGPKTAADRRALENHAEERTHHDHEKVGTSVAQDGAAEHARDEPRRSRS